MLLVPPFIVPFPIFPSSIAPYGIARIIPAPAEWASGPRVIPCMAFTSLRCVAPPCSDPIICVAFHRVGQDAVRSDDESVPL